ncbi:MAG: hypothetical protein ACK42A_07200 [Pyrinomonadaceae bacterium]|jgi:hypothetical protein
MITKCYFAISAFLFTILLFTAIPAQKLSAEELRDKHLQSIAKKEKLAELKNILATGTVKYKVLRQGGVGADGRIVLASDGDKSLVAMNFPISTYPSDKFIFDGRKVKIDFAYNNIRSYLGDFLYRYDDIVRDGLLGGVLSTVWPLHQKDSTKFRLDVEGRKTIDGREMIAARYAKKGGSDVEIRVYFDPVTFSHLRTEYRRTISSQIGSITGAQGASAADASIRVRELRQILVEEFRDFKEESGYNLPHTYRVYVLLDDMQGTREYEWVTTVNEFYINQPLDGSVFNTSDN